jgi:hypothetical protein
MKSYRSSSQGKVAYPVLVQLNPAFAPDYNILLKHVEAFAWITTLGISRDAR